MPILVTDITKKNPKQQPCIEVGWDGTANYCTFGSCNVLNWLVPSSYGEKREAIPFVQFKFSQRQLGLKKQMLVKSTAHLTFGIASH